MNQILDWLADGDLRSDGMATEAADLVIENIEIFGDLLVGITHKNDVIRARTADAMEKIAREKPELFETHLDTIIEIARMEKIPSVRMHLAMLFGHMLVNDLYKEEISDILFYLLEDNSVFTKSWAIVSLCILARKFSHTRKEVMDRIGTHQRSDSIAIRSKVRNAMPILLNREIPFPKGWIKSSHLQNL